MFKRKIGLFVLFMYLSAVLSGCSSTSTVKDTNITVGSKPFTENIILAEMMSQLIETHSKIKVTRKFNLGGTIVAFNALKNGDLDIYPEYTGTGLVNILKMSPQKDAKTVFDTVQKEFNSQFKLKWLKPWGFNNTYAISVKKEFAEQHHLTKLSDVAKLAPDMVFGANQDFYTRNDGYPGLIKTYNLQFKDTKQMEIGLKYEAIANNKVDIINGFATDGLLVTHKLVVLEDDKNYFAPYYGAPLIRMSTLEKHPEIEKILDKLSEKLTNEEMQKLNYFVDHEKKDPAAVAKDFLKTKGLI